MLSTGGSTSFTLLALSGAEGSEVEGLTTSQNNVNVDGVGDFDGGAFSYSKLAGHRNGGASDEAGSFDGSAF